MTRPTFIALAVAGSLVAAGCAAPDDAETAAAAGLPPVLAHAPLDWGDDFDHVIVFAAPTSPAPASPDDRQPDTTRANTYVLERSDGRVVDVDPPPGSLAAVQPDAAELALLQQALEDGARFASVVADPDGVVGPAGGRYLRIDRRLVELTPAPRPTGSTPSHPTDPAPTGPPPSAETLPAPGSFTGDSEAFAATLSRVDGVEDVRLVAPGVAAVALSAPRSVLDLDIVAAVTDDVLFDLSDDALQPRQWAVENTGSPTQAGGWPGVPGADGNVVPAWQVTSGAGVVVAVVDSGVDTDHPDLANRIWVNDDEICANGIDDDGNGRIDDCRGWDAGSNDADPNPDPGAPNTSHGTHVAGIVAAERNGVGIVGVAPEAQIMALKVSNTAGGISGSSVYAALVYAIDNGADVINTSLAAQAGTPRSAMAAIESAVQYGRNRGVLLVAAAGNSGLSLDAQPIWPASLSLYHDNVITVGAVRNDDTDASFSNHGSAVDIGAPGWWIHSAVDGGGWADMSGTSMAAPFVAGAAASVIASGTATNPAEVRARLTSTTRPAPPGQRIPNRVDVGAAVGTARTPSVSLTVGGLDVVRPDEPATVSLSVRTAEATSATAVRFHVAARAGGAVVAVGGLDAVFDARSGAVASTTSATGSFDPMPLAEGTSLTTGWSTSLTTSWPAGDYALIAELTDATGATVGEPAVVYLTVASATNPTTPDTSSPGPDSTDGRDDRGGDGNDGSTGGGTPTSIPSGGGGDAGGSVPTTTPSPAPSPAPAPAPSAPAPAPAPAPPGSSPAPPSAAPPPSGTSPAPTPAPTPTPSPAPAPTAPRTGAPVPTSPPAGVPIPTSTVVATPPPPSGGGPAAPVPVTDREYRLDTVSPNSASTSGGSPVTITGVFPTTVPVYVWFGELGIVQAVSTGSTLVLGTPPVPWVSEDQLVDLRVRFRTDSAYELTLAQSFTFRAASPSSDTPSSGTTPSSPAPSSPAPSSPTPSSPAPSTPPTPDSPPAPAPGSTAPPATGVPTPTPSPTTSDARTGAGDAQPVGSLGRLRLFRPAAGTVVAGLDVRTWPARGCTGSSCASG